MCCVVGDGEAETGPLATSWHSNKFLNPAPRRRGAAGAAPERLQDREPHRARAASRARSSRRCSPATATGRCSSRATTRRRCTCGWRTRWTRRSARSARSSEAARDGRRRTRPRWPMIVLRTPKGWTGPEGGGRPAGRGLLPLAPGAAGGRAHQPRAPGAARGVDAQLPARGAVRRGRRAAPELRGAARPRGERRMGANPHANGGLLLARPRAARLPRLRRGRSRRPARTSSEATRVLGGFLRDVMQPQREQRELPPLRPGRDRLQPPRRRVRGDRPGVGRRDRARGRPPRLPTAA